MIQVDLLKVYRVNGCKEVGFANLNQSLQLTDFILLKKLGTANIDYFYDKHFEKTTFIFDAILH